MQVTVYKCTWCGKPTPVKEIKFYRCVYTVGELDVIHICSTCRDIIAKRHKAQAEGVHKGVNKQWDH